MGKVKFIKKVLPIVLALMMILSSLPISFAEPAAEGTINPLTPKQATITDETAEDGKPMKVVTFDTAYSLDWYAKNNEIGRTKDGWWVGADIIAPDIEQSVLDTAEYYTWFSGKTAWSDAQPFARDRDTEKSIQVWPFVDESLLLKAMENKEDLVSTFKFDWNGDKTVDQYFKLVVKADCVSLKKDGETVFPASNLGTVSAITSPDSLAIAGSGKNHVTVKNSDNLTLSWSQADASIGRTIDAWWVGIKITAPEGMTVQQLKDAKLTVKGSNSWSTPVSFWDAKDSKDSQSVHWTGLWVPVKETDTGEKDFYCKLDWDADGIYEQLIDVAIDTDKVTLDKTNLYANDKADPVFTDMPKDATRYVGDDTVTLTGKVSDMGTKVGETTYTSGIKNAFYAVGSVDAVKHALTLNENGEFSITVSEEFEGYYYFFATDNAGNESAETKVLVKHDVAVPTLEEVSLSNENWTKDDITITGKALDSLSGVKKVGYVKITEDDGVFAEIDSVDKLTRVADIDSQNQFTLIVPADNYEGKIAVFAFDNVGRRSEAKVFSVKMDKSGFYSASAEGNSEWTSESILVQGSFVTTLSGLDKIEYKKNVDGSFFTEIPETDIKMVTGHETDRREGTYSFTIPQDNYDGDYIIRFTDRAGNVKEITTAVHQDNILPEINSLVVTPDGPTNGNVVITGTFTDNLSGVKEVWYTKNGSITKLTDVTIDGTNFRVEIPKQDFYGFYYFYCADNAQNESEVEQAKVKMDITAPEKVQIQYSTPVFSILASKIFFFKENCQVTLSTKDNLSNIESFTFSYTGSDQTTVNRDDSRFIKGSLQEGDKCIFDIPAQFRGSVVASAKDVAGNGTEDTVDENTLIVDNIPAVIDAQVLTEENGTKGDVNYYQDDVKIKVLVDEANFMDGEFEDINDIVIKANIKNENDETIEKSYSVNNWSKNIDGIWEGEFTITDEGDYTIHIDYTDKSGNVALRKEVSNITIDKTAPVINISYDNNDVRNEKFFNQARTATIKVTEHNFFPEDIDWQCTAHDYADNDVNVEDYGALLKDIAKWTKEGNAYTIDLPFTEEAKYAYSFAYTDPATNVAAITYAAESKATNDFVVDKTVPGNVTITYEENPIDVILSAITFHFYKGNLKVKLSATDNLSDIYAFKYSYIGKDDVVSENTPNIEEKTVTKADEGFAEKGAVDATYTFSIPAQFRGYIKATAIDYALNSTEVSHENSDIAVNDTKVPLIDIAYSEPSNPKEENPYGIDYYKDDVTVTLTVNEENFMDGEYPSTVRDMKISAEIIDDNWQPVNETYTVTNWQRVGETDTWQGSFVLSTEGDYTLTINYQDKSENKADTIVRDHLTIDKTAPKVETIYQPPVQTVTVNGDSVSYYNETKKPGLVIKVTEHNFDAADFASQIAATDVSLSEHIEQVENTFKNDLKNDAKWTHNGNIHTINVPLDSFEANYTINYHFEDLAKNTADGTPEKVTYDKTPAALSLTINSAVIRKILNGITFGIFNEKVNANVTITATDKVAGVETITYKSVSTGEGIGALALTTLDLKNPILNNKQTTAGVQVNNGKAVYTFKVPAQFRNGLQANAVDYSANRSEVNVIHNVYEGEEADYEGIIKDNKPGTVSITIPKTSKYASDDTFASDFDFHIELADENAGIGNVVVTLNDIKLDCDADGTEIKTYYEGDQLIRSFGFNINTSQIKDKIKEINNEDALKHGKYTLKVDLTDNAGNITETAEKTAYIDVFAPKISNFTFKTEDPDANAYVGNEAYKAGENVEVVSSDTKIYNYYFEDVTYVTVYAYDIDEGENIFNEHTCGIKDIRLLAVSHTGETAVCEAIDGSFVPSVGGKVGYSTKVFKVYGPFKGDLYAIAEDRANPETNQGNIPTNDNSRGLVDDKYIPVMSKEYEGYVNPYDTILENADKHYDSSDIEIIPNAQTTLYQSYNYGYHYQGDARFDRLKSYQQSKVPLYHTNVPFTLTVSDEYSGIKEINWSVVGQKNQDTKNNDGGKVVVDNMGNLTETRNGAVIATSWVKQASTQNIITKMSKKIVVKNNSNDIVILVELTDRAGNKSYDYYVLGIDRNAPQIKTTVSGSASNKMYFNTDRTITIEVTERNFNPKLFNLVLTKNQKDISLNGKQLKWKHSEADKEANHKTVHTASLTIARAQEGDYTLSVNAKDRADNKNEKPVYKGDAPTKFVIDSTPSNIQVSMTGTSKNEKFFFNTDRTVKIVITDRNFNPKGVSLTISANGRRYSPSLSWKQDQSGPDRNNRTTNTASFTISAEADYTFNITCRDLANNASNKTKYATDDIQKFTIDKTAPVAVIEKMVYQSANNGLENKKEIAIPIQVSVTDTNIGNMYSSNNVSGNELTETLTYATLTDSNNTASTFKRVSAARNKVVYGSNNLLDDGIYTLHLKVKDCAGNPLQVVSYVAAADKSATKNASQNVSSGTTSFFTFSVNRKGSNFTLGEYAARLFEKGQTRYVQNVLQDIVFIETNVDKLSGSMAALRKFVQIKKSGDPIDASKFIEVREETVSGGWTRYYYTIKKELFKDETDYVLSIASKDAANNTSYSNNFTKGSALTLYVDRTEPTVEILGLLSGEIYAKNSQHVKVTISDNTLLSAVLIIVNGKSYTIQSKDFDKYLVDGKIVWEYDFKESEERQNIEVKCWDAADNNNFNNEKKLGYAVENFLVSTNFMARVRFWINNNIPWFVLICVAIVAIIVVPIILIKLKKRKKEESE